MIPSIALKVQKEEPRKEQEKINIVRKGYMPYSEDDSSSDFDKGDIGEYKTTIEKKKPNRVIQKSTVVDSINLRTLPNANDDANRNDTNDISKPILSRRAQIRNKLVQKELESSLIPQSENKANELLNYIHEDNNNNNSYNTSIKEDVLDIKSFTPANSNNNNNNDNIHQVKHKKEKPIIQYETQREKQLMKKYVLNNNSDSDSDYLSSSDTNNNIISNNTKLQKNIRPIFVSKDHHNHPSQIKSELEKEADKAIIQKQLNTTKIIQSYIEKDAQSKELELDNNNIALPDDTDIPDDLEEYEQWKIRELKRIKRQIEENEVKIQSKIEIERRRNLTNEQRQEENIKLGSDATLKNFKSKINYLQKYYHKGAFFQDESGEQKEHIYNRDFNLPTWEDKIDRSAIPDIMAKRRGKLFKKGQTKYTHLTNEDTTNFDPAFKVPEQISQNLLTKSAGFKATNKFNNK